MRLGTRRATRAPQRSQPGNDESRRAWSTRGGPGCQVNAAGTLRSGHGVSLKGKRDRAILATLLYHALRQEELCKLTIKGFRHERRGVAHLKVSGKGSKTRYVPLHPAAHGLIVDYLVADGRGLEATGALFRAVGNRSGGLVKAITADAIYKIVRGYSAKPGFEIGAHALRATAATDALDHQADIAKVQEWLGHANIATTRIYDHRKTRAEDSPTFKVAYERQVSDALKWGSVDAR